MGDFGKRKTKGWGDIIKVKFKQLVFYDRLMTSFYQVYIIYNNYVSLFLKLPLSLIDEIYFILLSILVLFGFTSLFSLQIILLVLEITYVYLGQR
jgi:hypothetical protein